MFHRRTYLFLFPLALSFLVVSGCNRPLDSTVSGTVTLDGKPLPLGSVAFHPAAGGAVAYAGIYPDGRYKVATGTASGLAPGEYVITVTAIETKAAAKGGMPSIGKRLTPERYGDVKTSGLRFAVTKGSNVIDLPLKSR